MCYKITLPRQLSTNGDWAIWTDSYEFVQGDLPEYPDDNLSTDAMITLNLNMMLFINNEGALHYGKIVDLEAGEDIPLPDGFDTLLTDDNLLVTSMEEADGRGGFARTADGNLMMVTSHGILTSDGEGPVAGTLVLGYFIDDPQIAALSESLQLAIDIYPFAASDLPANVEVAKDVLSADVPTDIQVLDDETIIGYGLMQDITGAPISIITATMSRDIFAQGQQTVSLLALLFGYHGGCPQYRDGHCSGSGCNSAHYHA